MNLSIYLVVALLSAVACIIVGYGINNAIATSLVTQQSSSIVSDQHSSDDGSTIIQEQSSDQLQSNSASNSFAVGENIGDEIVSSTNNIVSNVLNSTNNIVSSVLNDTHVQIDRQSSGKIASSRLNPANGEVEAVLFGNWSLDKTSGFVADFIYKPSNGTGPVEYVMSGFELHSISQINNNLAMAGTIDVATNGRTVLQDAPVTIIIQNGILVVGFGKGTEATYLFGGVPTLGFEQ